MQQRRERPLPPRQGQHPQLCDEDEDGRHHHHSTRRYRTTTTTATPEYIVCSFFFQFHFTNEILPPPDLHLHHTHILHLDTPLPSLSFTRGFFLKKILAFKRRRLSPLGGFYLISTLDGFISTTTTSPFRGGLFYFDNDDGPLSRED